MSDEGNTGENSPIESVASSDKANWISTVRGSTTVFSSYLNTVLTSDVPESKFIVGVCTMDVKARSKPMRHILNRLLVTGEFDVVIFGDKVILDEPVADWPYCDFLISFFSRGFPLEKAIEYVELRKPYCVNDLPMQQIPFDRRMVLQILDAIGVQTPRRLLRNSNDLPVLSPSVKRRLEKELNIILKPSDFASHEFEQIDDDTIRIGNKTLTKPFVEKPVNGEDHHIYIYYHSSTGGGVRRLFRKIANKSSEFIPDVVKVRQDKSYIYEEFMQVDNAEDVKVYTIGDQYVHAETRKSPVVDGLVVRNADGKEVRYVAELKPLEKEYAYKISKAFGQYVCGLDMLRANGQTYVIDVNGWSFVKGNQEYYSRCASILRNLFLKVAQERSLYSSLRRQETLSRCSSPGLVSSASSTHSDSALRSSICTSSVLPPDEVVAKELDQSTKGSPSSAFDTGQKTALAKTPARAPNQTSTQPNVTQGPGDNQWKLKAYLCVLRHGDRTPKQKMKFYIKARSFVNLLVKNNPGCADELHLEEVVFKKAAQIRRVEKALETAIADDLHGELSTLKALELILLKKGSFAETKIQIKPSYTKQGVKLLEKVQVIVKWGGEFTHAGFYQSRDLGENMRKDLILINNRLLDDFFVYSSSERRVMATSEVFTEAFLGASETGEFFWSHGHSKANAGCAYKIPYEFYFRSSESVNATPLQSRSNSQNSIELYPDNSNGTDRDAHTLEALGPAKKAPFPVEKYMTVSKEMLDDSNAAKEQMEVVKMKLRTFLNPYVTSELPADVEIPPEMEAAGGAEVYLDQLISALESFKKSLHAWQSVSEQTGKIKDLSWCCNEDWSFFKERWEKHFHDFCCDDRSLLDISKVSELYDSLKFDVLHNREFLLSIFAESSFFSLGNLKDLYHRSKLLFDFIAPQEYGITKEEKFVIGLLNSRPLLRQIINDLKKASLSTAQNPFSRFYFTKESKVICLLNVVLLCGIPIIMERTLLDELDYLTKITFELYERKMPCKVAEGGSEDAEYSLRIGLSPGAHDPSLVDSQVDERHCLNVAPRKWLTDFITLDEALVHLERTERGVDPLGKQLPEFVTSLESLSTL